MLINYFFLVLFFLGTFITLFLAVNRYILKSELKRKLVGSPILENKVKKKRKQTLLSNNFSSIKDRLIKLTPNKIKENLEITLKLSGSKKSISDIILYKFLSMIILLFIGLLLTQNPIITTLKPLSITCFALLGFFTPDLILKRKGNLRKQNIKHALPSFIDYLSVAVEAGLGLDLAMFRVLRHAHGPLSEEIAYAMTEIQYGKSKRDAFKNLCTRVNIPELTSFLTALVNGDQLGISIGTILKIQGQQIREKRKQKIQEKAYKISVKLIFPLVLFILPGLFIVLLGPALIQVSKIFFK